MGLAKVKPYYYMLEQYLEIEREADERSGKNIKNTCDICGKL